MPQFDISSFVVQLVWLYLLLMGFYFLYSWKYLPLWALLLKTRKKPYSTQSLKTLNFEDYSLNNTLKSSKNTKKTKTKLYYTL